jgi:AraC-like DNA-binding protein
VNFGQVSNGGIANSTRVLAVRKSITMDMTPEYAVAAETGPRASGMNSLSVLAFERPLFVRAEDEIVTPKVAYNKSAEQIVLRALEYTRTRAQITVTVEDLVRGARVEYRTLLRAFHRYFGVGPKRYLRLQQLNAVRQALREPRRAEVTVTSIMTAHGVTELGRFATEYRRLFHEKPSETLKQSALSYVG